MRIASAILPMLTAISVFAVLANTACGTGPSSGGPDAAPPTDGSGAMDSDVRLSSDVVQPPLDAIQSSPDVVQPHGDASAPPDVPHATGTCSGLGAVGQWENITPPGVMLSAPYTGAEMVVVDPSVSGTLYATTSANGIFRSSDCGATWVKTNTGRNAQQLDSGAMWSTVIDPNVPGTLYSVTGYGNPNGLWKSTNRGVDWDPITPTTATNPGVPASGFVERVTLDPTNSNHLVIPFHDNCTAPHTPVCFAESTDGGATWTVKDFPASLVNNWAEGASVLLIDATHWLFQAWAIFYSADAGATWSDVSPSYSGAIQGPYVQTPDHAFYMPEGFGVITSHDQGATWSLIPNSGFSLDAIVGDGTHLFVLSGFQPPQAATDAGTNFLWSASYSDTTQWTMQPTTGMPLPLVSGTASAAYDSDHHLLYAGVLAVGLWRMVTQ